MRQIGWQSSTRITTSGETARLLSLSREYWAFTGGAHGNGATTGIAVGQEAAQSCQLRLSVLRSVGLCGAPRAPYCRALDAERKKRRGGDGKLGPGRVQLLP